VVFCCDVFIVPSPQFIVVLFGTSKPLRIPTLVGEDCCRNWRKIRIVETAEAVTRCFGVLLNHQTKVWC